MNLEDHPGYARCLDYRWTPLFIYGGVLFGQASVPTLVTTLVTFNGKGGYAGSVGTDSEVRSPTARPWFDKTFSPQNQETIWALASLHR